jgi:hypothetical protein
MLNISFLCKRRIWQDLVLKVTELFLLPRTYLLVRCGLCCCTYISVIFSVFGYMQNMFSLCFGFIGNLFY